MTPEKTILAVDTHTMGEPTRIILSDIGPIKGKTMAEKRRYFARHYDHYRTALMHEPRGHQDMFGAIIIEPSDPNAEIGVIFMDPTGYLNMCVHGTIGTITAALERGIIHSAGSSRKIQIDTPAGIIQATAKLQKNRVVEVSVISTPAFVLYESLDIDFPGIGRIPVDIVFSGSFFTIVESKHIGIQIEPKNIQRLIEAGIKINKIVNASVEIRHPIFKHIRAVDLTEITERQTDAGPDARNIVIFGRGQFDRSPCGTGTCAKMASLYTRQQLRLSQEFINESIIGTRFKGRLIKETRVGDIPAVVPEVTGRAHITGIQNFILRSDDPLSKGFLVHAGDEI